MHAYTQAYLLAISCHTCTHKCILKARTRAPTHLHSGALHSFACCLCCCWPLLNTMGWFVSHSLFAHLTRRFAVLLSCLLAGSLCWCNKQSTLWACTHTHTLKIRRNCWLCCASASARWLLASSHPDGRSVTHHRCHPTLRGVAASC